MSASSALDGKLSLRPARPTDVDWLVALRVRTMGPHLEASGEIVSDDDQYARVIHDFTCIRVIEIDGARAGMIKVVREPRQWKLVQIQLAPEWQCRGIGGAIVGDLLDEARGERVPVVLSVLKVNPARRLYERLGFRRVGEGPRAYEMRAEP